MFLRCCFMRRRTLRKKVMKSLTFIWLLFATVTGIAQGKVELTIANVKDTTGMLRVGIFKDEATFLKDAIIGKVVNAVKGEVTVVFDNVPAGKYALSVIHDENRNGELDSNFIGIPKEGFAFGNDAMGTFGPPSFEKAAFEILRSPKKLKVTMRYL
jgi:uncharacterized protein (DUF2141 family)